MKKVLSKLFLANYDAKTKFVINQGGTRSGKTFAILECILLKAIQKNGIICTVAGQTLTHLKKGAIRDLDVIQKDYREYIKTFNKTESYLRLKNDSIIEFKSYMTEDSAKGAERDILFVNEANTITPEIFLQLFIRTKDKIYIDYNPDSPFYVHEYMLDKSSIFYADGKRNYDFIRSWHIHNDYLSDDRHKIIETIGPPDSEVFKVYARGITGAIEGTMFPLSLLKFRNKDVTECLQSLAFIDPADGGDFFACIFVDLYSVDDELFFYVKDVIFCKKEIELTLIDFVEKNKIHKAETAFFESNMSWRLSATELKQLLKDAGSHTVVKNFNSTTDKMIRIATQQHFIKRYFVFRSDYKQDSEYSDFIKNLTEFNKSAKLNKNDDAPDVCAMCSSIIKTIYKEHYFS